MPNAIQKLALPLYQAAHWPDGADYQHAQRRWMVSRLLEKVPLDGVRVVVEVGCGDGWICGELARRLDATVVGFDANPYRIATPPDSRVLLVAGTAAQPVIAEGSADLIVTFSVFEHLTDRQAVLGDLARLLGPGGKMIHVVPTRMWKWLQWTGYLPEMLRKQARGLTRFLAGQRHVKQRKYYSGRETNNPARAKRQVWYRKLVPRVHGEYDNNFQEWRCWSRGRWRSLFSARGLSVVSEIPLGASSPYCFGFSNQLTSLPWGPLASMVAYVVEPLPQHCPSDSPKRPAPGHTPEITTPCSPAPSAT